MSLTRILRETPTLSQRLEMLVPFNVPCRVVGSSFPETTMPLTELSLLLAAEERSPQRIPMTARPRTRNYALVGTAFDYMLRVELHRQSLQSEPFCNEIVAERAVKLLGGAGPQGDDFLRYHAVFASAVEQVNDYVTDLMLEMPEPKDWSLEKHKAEQRDRLAVACIALAKIDGYYRNLVIDSEVGRYDELDWADLRTLFGIVPWDCLWNGKVKEDARLQLNPDFGALSELFNGADADLMSDGVLIDFKTTIHLDFAKHFPQLVGYTMLSDEHRKTKNDGPNLHRAGIYFARHGLLVTFDLDPVRADPDYQPAMEALWERARERHVDGVAFA